MMIDIILPKTSVCDFLVKAKLFFEVKAGTVIDECTVLFTEFKNHEKVKTLPTQAVLDAATKALQEFDKLAAEVSGATVEFRTPTWLERVQAGAKE